MTNAFATTVQTCTLVDGAHDWILAFDFSEGKVNLIGKNSVSTGAYQYTIEIVGGIDVFASTDKNNPWLARFHGSMFTTGNKAELVLGDDSVEFVCEAR